MPRVINSDEPVGTVKPFAGISATPPPGYLFCDGSALLRTAYAALFTALGTSHGDGTATGAGVSTGYTAGQAFTLPDYRGRFLRGADTAVARDPDRAARSAPVTGTFTLSGCSTSTTLNPSTITVPSTTNLSPGMSVSGTGIPANSVVLTILTTTAFQLGNTSRASVNATATNSSVTLTFSKAAVGDFVGSVQGHSTALPVSSQFSTGTVSADHSHTFTARGFNAAGGSGASGWAFDTNSAGTTTRTYGTSGISANHTHSITGGGDSETRPLNANVRYIIKY